MNKKILDENQDIIIYENFSLGQLQDIIEAQYQLLLSRDKRSKEYKEYKKRYNETVVLYNTKAKYKTYATIK